MRANPQWGRHVSNDRTARVWDPETGAMRLTLPLPSSPDGNIVFTPDGRRLVTAARTAVTVWDAATGREVLRLSGNPNGTNALAFSTDGRRLATGGGDGTVRVWEVE